MYNSILRTPNFSISFESHHRLSGPVRVGVYCTFLEERFVPLEFWSIGLAWSFWRSEFLRSFGSWLSWWFRERLWRIDYFETRFSWVCSLILAVIDRWLLCVGTAKALGVWRGSLETCSFFPLVVVVIVIVTYYSYSFPWRLASIAVMLLLHVLVLDRWSAYSWILWRVIGSGRRKQSSYLAIDIIDSSHLQQLRFQDSLTFPSQQQLAYQSLAVEWHDAFSVSGNVGFARDSLSEAIGRSRNKESDCETIAVRQNDMRIHYWGFSSAKPSDSRRQDFSALCGILYEKRPGTCLPFLMAFVHISNSRVKKV